MRKSLDSSNFHESTCTDHDQALAIPNHCTWALRPLRDHRHNGSGSDCSTRGDGDCGDRREEIHGNYKKKRILYDKFRSLTIVMAFDELNDN